MIKKKFIVSTIYFPVHHNGCEIKYYTKGRSKIIFQDLKFKYIDIIEHANHSSYCRESSD